MYIKLLHVPCLSPRHATCQYLLVENVWSGRTTNMTYYIPNIHDLKHEQPYQYSRFQWEKGMIMVRWKKKGVLITSSHPFLQWTNQKCIKAVTFPVGTSSFQSCSQIPLQDLWSLGRPDHKICLPSLPSHSKLSVPSDVWNSGWVKSYTPCTVIHIT